jgi:hypothetical protein
MMPQPSSPAVAALKLAALRLGWQASERARSLASGGSANSSPVLARELGHERARLTVRHFAVATERRYLARGISLGAVEG